MKRKHPECRVPRLRKRAGRCYELACKGQSQAPSWTLVHGWLDYGPAIGHAWLEKEGNVFCPTSDAVFTIPAYYALHHARVIAKFSRIQACVCLIKSNHYGPWEDFAELLAGVDTGEQ